MSRRTSSTVPRWFVPALVVSGLLVVLTGLDLVKREHSQ